MQRLLSFFCGVSETVHLVHSISSWLHWTEIECTSNAALLKRSTNQLKPVQQSSQKVQRAYYSNVCFLQFGRFQNVLLFSKCAFIFIMCFHFQNVLSFSKLTVLMYILCLQLMVVSSSMSLMLLLESIRSQQTSHRDSSSANCSSTMKLFSEQIFGLNTQSYISQVL